MMIKNIKVKNIESTLTLKKNDEIESGYTSIFLPEVRLRPAFRPAFIPLIR